MPELTDEQVNEAIGWMLFHGDVQAYSTDYNKAFKVVALIHKMGYEIVIWTRPSIVHILKAGADTEGPVVETKARTVPQAICKAAMLLSINGHD